jgi:surfeit locus 1 family protein
LAEKEYFIATIEDNIIKPAMNLNEFQNSPPKYSKIRLLGHFIKNKDIYLYGRRTASPEKDGYYLVSTFASDDGQTYMVSRGWFPASAKDKLNINNKFDTEIIEGMVLPGEKKNFVIPDNDQKNNVWFTLDLEMAAATLGSTITDFYVMQINSDTVPEYVVPLNTNNLSKVRNDHLEYAYTWYSLAGCLFIIFMVYSKKHN